MRGIPGSGKSTIAQMISNATNGVICSTDDFWYNEDGDYIYDVAKAGYAHLLNQRKVAAYMAEGQESIIVDNTNIKVSDMQPYLNLSVMFLYTVQVIPVYAELEVCKLRNAARNENRRIPEEVIDRMNATFNHDSDLDSRIYQIRKGQ